MNGYHFIAQQKVGVEIFKNDVCGIEVQMGKI
jgi:hypothetical protein